LLLIAVTNKARPEQGVGIVKRFSGQELIDLFHELDRPDSDQAIVGLQLAIPPQLNGSPRWIAEAVVDFARAKIRTANDPCVDTYAYRLASKAFYRDNVKVDSADILDWRSLYGVTHTDGVNDTELAAQQTWLSTVITRMVNVVNLPGTTDDSD
jgi:hypothetical protein